ncbi:MAG: hypothetical protein WC497_01800 [Patescibacteria group bacterium]
MRKPAVFPLIVLAAGLIASLLWYARSLRVGFLADDYDFLEHVAIAETQPHPVWSLARTSIGGASFFRPIINLSFWSDYQLYHYQATGFHLSNILLFGLSVGLTVLLVEKLTRHKPTAIAAGLLFLINPFASESVTWIAGRTDLWMLAGLLFTLYAFSRYRSKPSLIWLLLFLLGSLGALFSKENGIVFLPLIIIIDLFFYQAWTAFRQSLKNWRALARFILPYAGAGICVGLFFLLRRHILGFLLANTNSFGNSYFTYPAFADIWAFVRSLSIRILSDNGYAWLGLPKKIFLGFYAAGLVSAIIVFGRMFARDSRVFIRRVFFGIVCTLILALPISGFFSFVGPDHSNVRFLYVPMTGIAITVGIVFGSLRQRFWRIISMIGFFIILLVWSIGSWQGQTRYVLAHTEMEKVFTSFNQQVRPALASQAQPGLLLANLPGTRGGVRITPANIDFALGLRFPETKNAVIQMYGIVPIPDSLLCQLSSGSRQATSVFSYVWKNETFATADVPGRFLAKPKNSGVLLNPLKTGVADTAFPFVILTGYRLTWQNADTPFETNGLHQLVIPIESVSGKLPAGQPHIRFGFSETTQIQSDDIIAVPITQAMLDQGAITLDLCRYPRFYQFPSHRAFSWEWRNLSNLALTIGAPRFE